MSEPAETTNPDPAAASHPWRRVLRVALTERATFRDARRHALPWLAWLRRRTRSSELWLIAVATVVGMTAGALAVLQAKLAHGTQVWLFAFDPDERLSAQAMVEPWRLLAIPLGGLLLGLFTALVLRFRPSPAVDPVEANALHGGRLSIRDSAFICGQTLISNGCGASVGLEAAYAQAGGAAASWVGQKLSLRRGDLRILVGAGAGAAIAAAFGAPLTGAFYAFEIVIGAYTVANIAPVAAAALAGVLVAKALGSTPYLIKTSVVTISSWTDYLLYGLLGLVAALFGVALMRAVAVADRWVAKAAPPRWARPAIGGLALAAMAMVTPQTLSGGHGALHLDLNGDLPLKLLLVLILMKSVASIISLSFGFRGGLFFAALFLGALMGQSFSDLVSVVAGEGRLDPIAASLVGMGALGVAIVGGPFTMSFLVLEATGDFTITAATLAASLIASAVVRETFGYSFSTWRLHLRGETIRSAHDVSWMRNLTAGKMMRRDVKTVPAATSLAEFRRRFPLGSTKRAVLTGETGRYAGIVATAAVYAQPPESEAPLASLAANADVALTPELSIKAIMTAFDETGADELAVVDEGGEVIGLITEAHVTRRYAEELEKARRELTGDTG
ncbi:chloride channel protein [Caulobacter segnis]|uniref:chloride channel protein n=1 Tax=Caulobacter segnis TaxID=88688 RepID=UPI002861B7F5|nr:chloride channel protein [Caulobacter segnis]MDR6627925.1 CIC family chloride channel protein [Caulobacter segnis]